MNNIVNLMGEEARLVALPKSEQAESVVLVEYLSNHLLLVSPASRSAGWQIDQRFQLRINSKSVVYCYFSKIVRVCNDSTLCLKLELPDERRRSTITRAPRLKLPKKVIKITLQDGNQGLPVDLADISLKGACLVSSIRLGKINDYFSIELSISDGRNYVRLPCKIRYVRSEISGADSIKQIHFHHGVEFSQLTLSVENFLLRFVS